MGGFLLNLLECTLTMTALSCLLLALTPLLERRYSPRCLYALWLVVLVGFAVPVRPGDAPQAMTVTLHAPEAMSAASLQTASPEARDGTPEGEQAPTRAQAGEARAPSAAPRMTLSPVQTAFAIWLLGAAVWLAAAAVAHARFLRTVRRWGRSVGEKEPLDALARAKARAGVRRHVWLRRCPAVASPMLVGVLRPVILLPDTALAGPALELVLLHELHHLRRGDIPVKLLLVLVRGMHWFNPIMHWVDRALAYHCEASCDAWVMRGADLDARQYYSETLIGVIRRESGTRSALCTSYYGGVNGMKRRILSIMDTSKKRVGVLAACLTVALTLGTGLALELEPEEETAAVAAPVSTAAPEATQTPDRQALRGVTVTVSGTRGVGTRLCAEPDATLWETPLAVYYDGATFYAERIYAGEDWAYGSFGEGAVYGYVPLSDLVGATVPRNVQAASMPCGVVTAQTLLLSGAQSDAQATGLLGAGTEVTVWGRVGDWYHVQAGEQAGFVPIWSVRVNDAFAATVQKSLPRAFELQRSPEAIRSEETWIFERRAEAWGGDHGVPREGDISAQEATAIARRTVAERWGLDEGGLEPAEPDGVYFITVGEDGSYQSRVRNGDEIVTFNRPYYQVNLRYGDDPTQGYSVYIQPVTGEVLAACGPEDANG
ncbi:MAG TPA: hypothetical protein IAB73_02780 [Candidatus Onthenecus intestinigallinarum]|uniref:Peptidase M56 domain-containing protein n=1 Tax=Candidatus Onthenecus intestinigallinarum TaxID=2840875 RepID=A0A9D1CPR7_9FIRM|nr:hypothetical protein [Candidatus Onthenecus intestinigallinarum]